MIRHHATVRCAAFAAALGLAACGGGGGGTASMPAAHPTSAGTTAPTGPAGPTTPVSFRIDGGSAATSAKTRTPKFISPSTQSATISLLVGSTPTILATVNLTPGSTGCVTGSSGLVCTVTINAPIGQDTFVINTYDQPNAAGNLLSTATDIATIALNATNIVAVALNGVIASVKVILGSSSVVAGTPATTTVNVVAFDAQNNVIIGPGNYSTPVTLTNSDTTGIVTLSSTQVLAPGAPVTLSYSGASSVGATITPAAGTAQATPAFFSPTGYAFTTFPLPISDTEAMTPGVAVPGSHGPTGNVWYSQFGMVGYISPSGAANAYQTVPQEDIYGLALGSDGNVWWGGFNGDAGSITPGGVVTPISSVITPNGCASGGGDKGGQADATTRRRAQGGLPQTLCSGVNWIVNGPDNRLWFSDDSGMIGNIDPATRIATEWDLTQRPSWPAGNYAEPEQIAFGPDGKIYASDNQGLIDQITVNIGSHTVTDATQIVSNVGCDWGGDALAVTPDGTLWTGDECANLIIVPPNSFATGSEQTFSIAAISNNDSFGMMALTPGSIWAVDFNSNLVYRISGTATAPAISTLTPWTSAFEGLALSPGPDGNMWAAADPGGNDFMAKIAYGVPPAGAGSLSLVRALPAGKRTAARNLTALQRHHKPRPKR
jgi:streptogramin lyase